MHTQANVQQILLCIEQYARMFILTCLHMEFW